MKYTKLVEQLLRENDVLIACHQGSAGGNIAYNTYRSMQNAIRQGAHIVEFDVCQSKDGVFHVFHENEEPIRFNRQENFRTFTSAELKEQTLFNMNMQAVEPPPTLKDFMAQMKNHPNTLLHFDHAQKWGATLLQDLDQYEEQRETMIIKTDVAATECLEALAAHDVKYMTLPKVWSQADFEKIMEYQDQINIVGFEMIFTDPTAEYVSKEKLDSLRQAGYHTMINAIVLWNDRQSLCGGYDDDVSLLENADLGWGKLHEMGFDVIQTDWPFPLKKYLEGKGVNLVYDHSTL
ncbi:glycerophosphodiester phosphodiesterase family protein [Bacillaceae bacterium SIJ1]|uniref:glycerophosphodiester phosphodiesterase family protein n=1 Tax=Litoribacterium kuwaitense TaxID=1398745 RepID=UPI0013EBF554|nr:glycerophosphodiester phosphodiesterase family protein [Litoribacterium kuwaitense]NGP43804.1 glycerophosphodiester phosphodiesterase family protein [Litoribacterium kuwaitense]